MIQVWIEVVQCYNFLFSWETIDDGVMVYGMKDGIIICFELVITEEELMFVFFGYSTKRNYMCIDLDMYGGIFFDLKMYYMEFSCEMKWQLGSDVFSFGELFDSVVVDGCFQNVLIEFLFEVVDVIRIVIDCYQMFVSDGSVHFVYKGVLCKIEDFGRVLDAVFVLAKYLVVIFWFLLD